MVAVRPDNPQAVVVAAEIASVWHDSNCRVSITLTSGTKVVLTYSSVERAFAAYDELATAMEARPVTTVSV